MKNRLILSVIATLALGGALVGCNTDTSETQEPSSSSVEHKEQKPDTSANDASHGALPDLTGFDLQYAQDTAQAAGFYALGEQDASGLDRIPLWDRNWTVCSQTPSSGSYVPDTTVTFYVVKDTETCP